MKWPPLVGSDRVPRYIVIRDYALTLIAWCVFAWMLRNVIALTFDWFREPFGQLTYLQAPDWPKIWLHLRNYVVTGAMLIVWIAFWSVYRSKDLRPLQHTQLASHAPHHPLPAPLEPQVLCQRYGVDPAELAQWQQHNIVTVAIAADGKISRVL